MIGMFHCEHSATHITGPRIATEKPNSPLRSGPFFNSTGARGEKNENLRQNSKELSKSFIQKS